MIIFPKICCRELLGVKLLTFLLSNSPMHYGEVAMGIWK